MFCRWEKNVWENEWTEEKIELEYTESGLFDGPGVRVGKSTYSGTATNIFAKNRTQTGAECGLNGILNWMKMCTMILSKQFKSTLLCK